MNKFIFFVFFGLLGFNYHIHDDNNSYFKIAKSKLQQFNPKHKDYVVIIDYRKNIFSERLYLLDTKNEKIILNCRVSHAWASGFFYPKYTSNVSGSEKSSVGAFITKNSRPGQYGYSMVIKGVENGKNNNVEKRVIIFHPTRNPWSKGCFATSKENNKVIIDHMKNGRLVYVIN